MSDILHVDPPVTTDTTATLDLAPPAAPADTGATAVATAVTTTPLPVVAADAALAAAVAAPPKPAPANAFFGLTPRAFDEIVVGRLRWPKYRAQQVRQWAYEKLVGDPAEMTNLSKLDRDRLGEQVGFARATLAREQRSEDGTRKLLLEWAEPATADGRPGKVANAETVMIPDADRRTACVSSQVGCPVGCKFCASGVNGVKGNLTADQIVEQVFALNAAMKKDFVASQAAIAAGGQDAAIVTADEDDQERAPAWGGPRAPTAPRITNIVFMGMGEPLANYANVMRAIRILHDPACFNIGARKITISTVGVPARMRELADEELPLNLAISLHAPTEGLRRELIPWAEHFALGDILEAARYYFDRTGREVTLEYILLAGVNDQVGHAKQLAKLCKTLRANVNLIRYNEVDGLPFGRPKANDVLAFQAALRAGGVNAHVRKSRGRDIDAACGQLRRKRELEQQQAAAIAV